MEPDGVSLAHDESADAAASATLTPPMSAGQPTTSARRSILRWVGGMSFVAVALIVGVGLAITVPYVALVPGTVRDTEPLLEVEGIDQYPSEGGLFLTTVRVRQRPNVWEYLWLRTDDDAEVVAEEVILGDRTPEENREFNLELMNDSKQKAVAVALEELGYDAVRADAVVVTQIVEGAAAEGILELGDSITAIDGEATFTVDDLVTRLGDFQPGDTATFTVERFGQESVDDIDVTLGDHPDRPGAAFLGIQPASRLEFADDFDFIVEIESGDVGGPSAGLAFTLAVLDQLTVGELTGGEQVAVTGTIDAEGRVGPVGGVLQKTAAVRDLGVDAFIVPAQLGEAELAKIEERAGDSLEILPVFTLEEALDALATLGGDVQAVREFEPPVS